jgi:hypothetical protein
MVAVRPNDESDVSLRSDSSAAQSLRARDAAIPQRYRDPATSKLVRDFVDGRNNLPFS